MKLLNFILPIVLLSQGAFSAPDTDDPCAKIAGKSFSLPRDVQACYKSFPFNETIRQNVLTVVSRVFDFYTFEDFYTKLPDPFEGSTVKIRETIDRINKTEYSNDYHFMKDVYDFTLRMNDGHTRFLMSCYTAYQNMIPAPLISLWDAKRQEHGVFIAPNSVELVSLLGEAYYGYYDSIGFDWKRLAGAQVLAIEGADPYDYVDRVADWQTGNYLDHGVRVNSVFTSYRISGGQFSQRLGDLAGPVDISTADLTFKILFPTTTEPEDVTIPYYANMIGTAFKDKVTFWNGNCKADKSTNGIDLRPSNGTESNRRDRKRFGPEASIHDPSHMEAIALPEPYLPTAPTVVGTTDVIKSYVLPGNQTGVMYVSSFGGDYYSFQLGVAASMWSFQQAGVTQLLIDVSNNGGGYVCLGHFLHAWIAGLGDKGYAGFDSTNRANPLAQKIVSSAIDQNLDSSWLFYAGNNWAFTNGTRMYPWYNYMDPTINITVNGKDDKTSQRLHDVCDLSYIIDIPTEPTFNLSNVAIVSNGLCSSTCALFSTSMSEKHKTKIAVFGGKPGEEMEYRAMAGNQVMDWPDLDTEIKTTGLKSDPLAPPDLIVKANMRHNWRTAYGSSESSEPLAYVSARAAYRFPYTRETYNNPQNVWSFAASELFPSSE
ncbi:hypothetical protein D9611_009260 [Ephemerocybe angulata]|uniref:Tail specific protease domain-containing protein n=1 Tax=Ephemerocybe angulata TaxID=980116 RepID=A0A8H5BH79_9AGAR|nr:hypothetical protein D9611_009260 [Tulosesus angulatus]